MFYDKLNYFNDFKRIIHVTLYAFIHDMYIQDKQIVHSVHCATAFSMQSCAESAYQPYADEYH